MQPKYPENYIRDLTLENDAKNRDAIERARTRGLIDDAAAAYLKTVYKDGMDRFREVFYILGRCLGAPKTAVRQYDYSTGRAIDAPVTIPDINPVSPYIVHHRLDADPMRNQFFNKNDGYRPDLAVSSIITVIVGAQKNIKRSLDKITGKYYDYYTEDVISAVRRVLTANGRAASGDAVAKKISDIFAQRYVTNASEVVLSIIGAGHEQIAVALVRELDKIRRPYMSLRDVWRVKCLFDLIPQARTFIANIQAMFPTRVISVRDAFYDVTNPRNYRDAKVIINIGNGDEIIPMEIICQVRTFSEYELLSHKKYEIARKNKNAAIVAEMERETADLHSTGVKNYNMLIYNCLESLFDRVGWNILYGRGNNISMFDGFPPESQLHYPTKVLEAIAAKLDDAIKNEIFRIENAPSALTMADQSRIFRYMAGFILSATMPYSEDSWNVPSDTMPGKLFNFVMKELRRYYKK